MFITKDYEDYLKDIPKEITQKLEIVAVDQVDDVLKATGILKKQGLKTPK